MRAPFRSDGAGARELALLGAVGVGILAYGAFTDRTQTFAGLLVASLFGLSLSLGVAVFVAIQGVSGSRWWRPLRRVAGAFVGTFSIPGLTLLLTLVLGLKTLYPWARPGAVAASELLRAKAAWLNAPFFLARAILVLFLWAVLLSALRRRLGSGVGLQPDPGPGFVRTSVVFLLVLAPTLSVASWDWAMSLDPAWYSTMFSVYLFSGTFLAGIAVVALLAVWLGARVPSARLSPDALHDLGKLLFAFGTFWAYIWFSQYLLIWYSNLPQETPWYAQRLTSGWTLLFWLNPVLNFGVPFVALLSAGVKRRPAVLAQVALLVLLGRWLDSYLLVAPASGPLPVFPSYGVVATLLVTMAMLLRFARLLRGPSTAVRPSERVERLPVLPSA